MNSKHFKNFSFYLSLITILITTAGWIIIKTWMPDRYFKGFLLLPLLFLCITLALHWYLVRSSRKEIIKFTPRFMGATGIKMMLYVILIVVYLLIDRAHAVSFLIWFLICYFLYTVVEILSILRYINNNK
jgi:hypothetical protein